MKILHCCLAAFYIDNYGYQENVLTRVHKQQGYEVMILASTETIDKEKGITYIKPSSYFTSDGIPVTRLPYVKIFTNGISRKLRIYRGVKNVINDFSPDIIFMHDGQTAAVYPIVKYVKEHPHVKLYIDSHTDFVNSANTWISRNILHGIIYKRYVQHTIPYTTKYYGTLPARVDFYTRFYGTPASKTEYLPMGIDDLNIDFSKRLEIRKKIREELDIPQNSFVVVSGGKINKLKNIHILLQAFKRLQVPNVNMILFGSMQDDIKEQVEYLVKSDNRVKYIGWLPSTETYKYFFASDLACFPGTHSTLWEESVGYGIPTVFKYWDGITHIDRKGNCILLKSVTEETILNLLSKILEDQEYFEALKDRALSPEVMDYFAYSKIAKKAIEL